MTNLVIDIGNTFTKIAVFELDELLTVEQFETVPLTRLGELLINITLKRQ
jgi:type III pantothenate kinase